MRNKLICFFTAKNRWALPPFLLALVTDARALLLALLCLMGSACTYADKSSGEEIPNNTQLAVSPNGNRIIVSWNGESKKLYAKLVELNGNEVASIRDIVLPPKTFTTAFGNSNDQLLVTTLENGASEFLKFDLNTKEIKRIYKSQYSIRFPIEVEDENYVFLEGQEKDSMYSKWQRYYKGEKTLLNDRPYRLAAPLSMVNGALFVLEPRTPPKLVALTGVVPDVINELVEEKTGSLRCTGMSSITCVRMTTTINLSSSLSMLEFIQDKYRCDIHHSGDKWVDLREIRLSRDGSTVTFHSTVKQQDGLRVIYFVKNKNKSCTANAILIKGK